MSGFPASGENVKLGKGSLMLDLFDDAGLPTGLQFTGNASAISMSADVTKAELFTSTQGSGALLASNRTQTAYTLSATLNEFTLTNLKLFLIGTDNVKTQDAASDVAIALNDVVKGRYYELGKRNVTGVTLTKATTALVLNTDYTLNSEFGVVHILPTSPTVLDGDDITGTMDVPAATINQIRIGQKAAQTARLVYMADDANSDGAGARDRLEVWRVDIAPDGELNVISDDYGSFNLSMTVISDTANHPADPFGNLERVA